MLHDDVLEAFRSAGGPDDKARRAAEAFARDQGGFAMIELKLELHTWMIGAVFAMNVAVLVRLLVSP